MTFQKLKKYRTFVYDANSYYKQETKGVLKDKVTKELNTED